MHGLESNQLEQQQCEPHEIELVLLQVLSEGQKKNDREIDAVLSINAKYSKYSNSYTTYRHNQREQRFRRWW